MTGVANTDNINVDTTAKTATLTKSNLNNANVTITGDYKLEIASDITAPEEIPAGFDNLTYKGAGNTDGYTLAEDGKTLNYTTAKEGESLFTLTGVTDTASIVVDTTAKTVTLSQNNFTGANITISGTQGYKLALDKDYSPTQTDAGFVGLTYKSAGTSDGYTLAEDGQSVTYTASGDRTDLFTLEGVTDTSSINVDNTAKTATIAKANLTGTDVTISGTQGYKLAVASDVTEAVVTPEGFVELTYKSESNTEGYKLADDGTSIAYTSAVAATDLFTLAGVANTTDIAVDKTTKTATLTASNLNEQTVTIRLQACVERRISDGYEDRSALRRFDLQVRECNGRLRTGKRRLEHCLHGGSCGNRSVHADQRHRYLQHCCRL